MNEINKSRGSIYIKERNKLIVKLLISGLKPIQIIDLRKGDISTLNIKKEYKKELHEFVYNYNSKSQDVVILDVKQMSKIKTATINHIKKRYIKNKI